MKIKSIKVGYGRTVQFEQYESTRFDAEASADLDDDDDLETCANDLRAELKTLVKKWIKIEERSKINIVDKDIPF